MRELLRTNQVGLLHVIGGLLTEAEIPHHIADRNMSILEGSILAIAQRVMVPEEYEEEARTLMVEAELGHWLRPERPKSKWSWGSGTMDA